MTKKIHVDCREPGQATHFADWLEQRGYRYGYSGRPCERRSGKNMPFITIDLTTGFYSGSKGADVSVKWHKLLDIQNRLVMSLPTIGDIHKQAAKDVRPKHNHMLVESKDGRKMERVWYTKNGRCMGISRMDDDHLHNTILMIDRTIAMGGDVIGQNKDLAHLLNEMEDERIHRGLHLPLLPLISIDYRKENF